MVGGHDGGMSDVDRGVRATSFGAAAEEYARYRPAPPAAAAEWALGASRDVVIDLAAGTGNLTQHLIRDAASVVAVDIDARMLAVLGRRLPNARRVAARGEAFPFRPGAAGAVVISSAWHWLDHDAVWPELARVIRSGGSFAVMWSGPDRRVPWVADVLGQRSGGRDGVTADGRDGWFRRWQIDIPGGIPFSGPEERTFVASVPFAVSDLPGLVASYSRVMVLPVEHRRAAVEAVAGRAAACPDLVGLPIVDLPLRCRVWRAVRDG